MAVNEYLYDHYLTTIDYELEISMRRWHLLIKIENEQSNCFSRIRDHDINYYTKTLDLRDVSARAS